MKRIVTRVVSKLPELTGFLWWINAQGFSWSQKQLVTRILGRLLELTGFLWWMGALIEETLNAQGFSWSLTARLILGFLLITIGAFMEFVEVDE